MNDLSGRGEYVVDNARAGDLWIGEPFCAAVVDETEPRVVKAQLRKKAGRKKAGQSGKKAGQSCF